ncbi:hypothetical protein [Streptomyces sp. NPDC023838]|uniref:hypothetical protein n=1 Tax=Streptomyces sp. NPDC023838 TaxID=3154325 RepID=UPI0033DE5D55
MAETNTAGAEQPGANWQLRMVLELQDLASRDSRILALKPHGSAAGHRPHTDQWSDLDLSITTTDPTAVAEDFALKISARYSPVFATSRSGTAACYTLRLVLSDLRRLDITATDPTPSGRPTGAAHETGSDAANAVPNLINEFRFDAVLSAIKAARRDVLIGAHLALQLARHVLVIAMLLHDRDAGTNHHRFGDSRWDAWASRLAAAPTPYTHSDVTAAIRFYLDVFEEVLSEWDVVLPTDNRPLRSLLDAVDEQLMSHQTR